MSLNISNIDKSGANILTKVFKNDKGKYSIGISKKVNDKYESRYFPVEFLQGVELENGTEILIKHAFMTWFDWDYDGKQGTKFVIKIIAFEEKQKQPTLEEVTPQNINDKWESAKNVELEPDDLPFY